MNGKRQHIERIWNLPYQLKMTFSGPDGAPELKEMSPYIQYEGKEESLARLKVTHRTDKQVIVELPSSLSCWGLGRYEVMLNKPECLECDHVKVEFKGSCSINRVEGCEIQETPRGR